MKEERLEILRKLKENTISPNEADKQLCDLFNNAITSSIEDMNIQSDVEVAEAFENNMEFNRLSFKDGSIYMVGRLKKHWLD